MKKTLLMTLDYPPMVGGVANYYRHLVEQLPQESIVVLDNAHGELLSSSRWVWPKWLKAVSSTYRLIKKEKIEHLLVGQILPLGTVALMLHLWLRIPYTVMTHAMDVTLPFGPEGSRRKQWLIKNILHKAAAVTTVSSFTKNKLRELGVQSHKIFLVYPCPHITPELLSAKHPPQDYSRELRFATQSRCSLEYLAAGIAQGKKIILSVGRLVERKGFDMVIRALPELRKIFPNILYIIVGDGTDRQRLEQIAREQRVDDIVHFTEVISDEAIAQWFAACTFFVMPSRKLSNNDVEGFGIVYLEANSFGKPVIAGNSGGVHDAVIDGQTGLLVEPENVTMLTQAMNRFLDDSAFAQRLGQQGQARVHEQFRWSLQAQTVQRMLE
ncbi:MAG: glycosyltransferase family 4 protein [Candidatus Kerfeldbacteria bacterium]|nr:glycosyltransferase family 4 protein [Candidatus Kerfeldbacteria bacterium]